MNFEQARRLSPIPVAIHASEISMRKPCLRGEGCGKALAKGKERLIIPLCVLHVASGFGLVARRVRRFGGR